MMTIINAAAADVDDDDDDDGGAVWTGWVAGSLARTEVAVAAACGTWLVDSND